MVTEGAKRTQASVAIPPRKINVQKYADSRAPELESLHSIIGNRVNNDFRSQRNKRRRTTSFDNQIARKACRRKRKKLGIFDKNHADSASEKDQIRKLPRRVRRKLQLRMNPESGFCTSGDGTKRLRTHVWHAKRFTMTKLWGYYLPLGLQGRGRGSRVLLKRFKHGALVHDASYCTAVQLEGPEDSLISVLRMVLEPSSVMHPGNDDSVLSGATYGTAMLYGVGAPVSEVIAPVDFMWRPIFREDKSLKLDNVECRTSFRQHDMSDETSIHDINKCNKSDRMRQDASFRQLWVWIHASAFKEGYDILKLACEKEMEKRGIIIKCFSLEGQLAKLELMGAGAFQFLRKILHPVTGILENHWHLKRQFAMEENNGSQNERSPIVENEEKFSSHALISLNVKDPRELPSKSITSKMEPSLSEALCDAQQAACKELPDLEVILEENEDLSLPSWSKLEDNQYDNSDLWSAPTKGLRPPFQDSVISKQKHHKRIVNFCLDENSVEANSLMEEQCSRSCPIVLLKNDKKGIAIGWSVILPLSWVKAFWIHFISNGAHAIGLREKQWIACEMGLPFFPSDFPDCKAYSNIMAVEAAALNHKAELRPPSIRPFRVPIPPPWGIVRVTFVNETSIAEVPEVSMGKDVTYDNPLPNSCHGGFNISSFECDCNMFDGIVARTGYMLTTFLNEIQAGQSLLFPYVADRKARVRKFIKAEVNLDTGLGNSVKYDRKLCFLRVHLRPCKKGIFEEGAVVCAPCPSDMSSWISSSEESDKGLQMSECDKGLYFREQPSGKWGLHIPDDSLARESHRWPIGFVTTASVRGSKELVAEGFCEAVLLAHLREEQWKVLPAKRRKMEIYVLVRNLRSSAYRLALASIVLEHQENDIDFL